MRRACRPMWASPMSPSISARGVRAATESTTMRSMAPVRTSVSVISSALLAAVRLRDQEVVELDPEPAGVVGVESVLGVDEGAHAAARLGLGDGVQGQRRLAGRLRAVDLDDAAARQAADPEREVERQRAGRDDLHLRDLLAAEAHDRPVAELLLDDLDRFGDGSVLVRVVAIRFAAHWETPCSMDVHAPWRRLRRSIATRVPPQLRGSGGWLSGAPDASGREPDAPAGQPTGTLFPAPRQPAAKLLSRDLRACRNEAAGDDRLGRSGRAGA